MKVGFRIPIGSCIPDSKTQVSGLKENIPWFWIRRAKISRIPKSGYTYVMRVLCKRFVVQNPYIPVNWASAFPRVTFDRTKEQEYRPRSSMVTFVTKRAVHPSDWPQELGGDISETMICFSFCFSSFPRNSHFQAYKWDVKWGTFFALQTKVAFVSTMVSDDWPKI